MAEVNENKNDNKNDKKGNGCFSVLSLIAGLVALIYGIYVLVTL